MTRPFWTQRQDIGPSARNQSAMTYDAGLKRVVLFGGDGGSSDTWEWDGELWTQVADTGPSARSGHGIAYDAERKRTVLFGGNSVLGIIYRDTWEWDGGEWTQVADTGPTARTNHSLSFDSARKEIILFGGKAGPVLGDTWAWTAPSGHRSRTSDHSRALDMRRPTTVSAGDLCYSVVVASTTNRSNTPPTTPSNIPTRPPRPSTHRSATRGSGMA